MLPVQLADFQRILGGTDGGVARDAQHALNQQDIGVLVVNHQDFGIQNIGGGNHGVSPGAASSCEGDGRVNGRIATDAKGVIQIFNVGAECMLDYRGSYSPPVIAAFGAAIRWRV